MILYFDASALVKQYVEEPESASVARWLGGGKGATSRFSLVEVASALARRERAGDLVPGDAARLSVVLESDSRGLTLVELTPEVEKRARDLALVHSLRAGDSLQLASCLHVKDQTGEAVEFVAYDRRLVRAASNLGLRTRGARPA